MCESGASGSGVRSLNLLTQSSPLPPPQGRLRDLSRTLATLANDAANRAAIDVTLTQAWELITLRARFKLIASRRLMRPQSCVV